MKLASAPGTSSIASTSTPGASRSTREPDSCDNEAAVRAKAMLITSPSASLCFSVSNISRLLQSGVHGRQNFVLDEWFGDELFCALRKRQLLRRLLYVRGGNNDTGVFVHLTHFLKYFHPRHPFHDQIQEHDVRLIEKVLLDRNHSVFCFDDFVTRTLENSTQHPAGHSGIIDDQNSCHKRPPRLPRSSDSMESREQLGLPR